MSHLTTRVFAFALTLGTISAALAAPAGPARSDGAILAAEVRAHYPSVAYVARYRAAFPAERQGDDVLWMALAGAPVLRSNEALVEILATLQDQHVAVAEGQAGGTETLGVLFRTATDGSLMVWRVFDPGISGLTAGDFVESIDGMPAAAWLASRALHTFGGNRRSRMAEAGLELGLGSKSAHRVAQLGSTVALGVASTGQPPRVVSLAYLPMSAERAASMAAAVEHTDLPRRFDVDGVRIGAVRLGAFAPQYIPAFTRAADAAAEVPGTTDDEAMLAGFCAVARGFIADVAALNAESDLLVVDLRGNLGGFAREARLLAVALASRPLPESFDVFASGKAGLLLLKKQPTDPSCGRVVPARPILVFTDAGTRSAGEFMATWLWASGATVIGERTIGAGGGRDATEQGFELPGLEARVKLSGNFTFFDAGGALKDGLANEQALLDVVAQDGFAPSRTRPFAIQSAGLRPDVDSPSTAADLRDGGRAQLARAIRSLQAAKQTKEHAQLNRETAVPST